MLGSCLQQKSGHAEQQQEERLDYRGDYLIKVASFAWLQHRLHQIKALLLRA
jgi:hypothetical protein